MRPTILHQYLEYSCLIVNNTHCIIIFYLLAIEMLNDFFQLIQFFVNKKNKFVSNLKNHSIYILPLQQFHLFHVILDSIGEAMF
jgi:hypothetical protein